MEQDDESRILLVPAIFYLVFTTLDISHEGTLSLLAHWRKRLGGLSYWLWNPYDSGGITVPAHGTREGEGA